MGGSLRRGARATLAWALVVTGALASCGGGDPQATDGATAADGQFVDCSQEARATPYAPGTVARSEGGQMNVTLVDNRPGAADANNPPGTWVRGSNTWLVEVRNTSGRALDGLTIQTVPRMPDHNHGTSVTPVTAPQGSGQYVISPLYLYMSGYWQVTLNISPPAADAGASAAADGGATSALTRDSVVFNVCIPG